MKIRHSEGERRVRKTIKWGADNMIVFYLLGLLCLENIDDADEGQRSNISRLYFHTLGSKSLYKVFTKDDDDDDDGVIANGTDDDAEP